MIRVGQASPLKQTEVLDVDAIGNVNIPPVFYSKRDPGGRCDFHAAPEAINTLDEVVIQLLAALEAVENHLRNRKSMAAPTTQTPRIVSASDASATS